MRRVRFFLLRIVPATIIGRMTFAVLLLCFVILGVAFGSTWVLSSRQLESVAQSTARTRLLGVRAFLSHAQGDLARPAEVPYKELLRQATEETPYDHRMRRSDLYLIGLALRDRTGATAVLVTSGDAARRFEYGSRQTLDRMSLVVADHPKQPVNGLMWLGQDTHVVVARPLPDGGNIVLAEPLSPLVATDFRLVTDDLRVSVMPPDSASSVTNPVTGRVAGFTDVRTEWRNMEILVSAEVPGLADTKAGRLDLVIDDPRLDAGLDAVKRAGVTSAVIALLLGLGLSFLLSYAVRIPVDRTVRDVEAAGALALEGASFDPIEDRPSSPREFRRLRSAFNVLLTGLATRQAELKAAVATARDAEQALTVAVDSSAEAKLLIERGVIRIANPAATAAFGVPTAALLGHQPVEALRGITFATEDDTPLLWPELVRRALVEPLTVRCTRADGSVRWQKVAAVEQADAEHRRTLVTAADVTEDRRRDALRDEIVSVISHDLRAPLTVINGYLDILRRPLEDGSREHALDSAKDSSERMAALLDDLAAATRADSALAPTSLAPVPLDELAFEVADSMRAVARGHRIEVAAEAVTVHGDEKRLRQALVNLVSNALKYTPADSAVTIRVARVDHTATLAVEDEGPGIPAEARETVFARYARLDAATGKQGLGLGLYIVRTIAENHGGSVRVEEAPGGGARFVIELPIAPDAQ